MELTTVEAARLRASLNARLNVAAKARGASANQIRKQYVFTMFLGQLFRVTDVPWVLLGGNALLIRTGGGRFTQDIDLAREAPWANLKEVRRELQEFVDVGRGDSPFLFDLRSITPHSEINSHGYGAATANIKVDALLSGTVFDTFMIDITARRHLDAPVDQVALIRVIEHRTLDDLPTVPTTPVENHLADKVCALYETHGADGATASTRYRDLADIVRLIQSERFDAQRLQTVLGREIGRRGITLPDRVVAPHANWATAFPRAARDFADYPEKLYPLGASLAVAGKCLDEVVAGQRATGTWHPQMQRWDG